MFKKNRITVVILLVLCFLIPVISMGLCIPTSDDNIVENNVSETPTETPTETPIDGGTVTGGAAPIWAQYVQDLGKQAGQNIAQTFSNGLKFVNGGTGIDPIIKPGGARDNGKGFTQLNNPHNK